jgi:hypothetical protein
MGWSLFQSMCDLVGMFGSDTLTPTLSRRARELFRQAEILRLAAGSIQYPGSGNRNANYFNPKSFRRLFGLRESDILWMRHKPVEEPKIFLREWVFFCMR